MKRGLGYWFRNTVLGLGETANAVDKTANAAVFMGDGAHTISARTGKALVKGQPWAKYVAGPAINALMLNRHHCVHAALDEGLITPEEEAAYLARHKGL